MTNTEPFDKFEVIEPDRVLHDEPTKPVENPEDTGKAHVYDELAVARSKEYLEEQADRSRNIETTSPPWTQEAEALTKALWDYQVLRGHRIWIHPDGGFWKREDRAHALMSRGWSP